MKEKIVAIILAAGQGKRMQSKIQKQYMELQGYPILYYSLKQFEKSVVDEIILVVGAGEESYCRENIVKKYNFQKVSDIISGGKERYESVYFGLSAISEADYVLIHDGARPFLNQKIIECSIEGVKKHQACVVGMPVKDTIKIVDEKAFAVETPKRESLWLVQTPQSFEYSLVKEAYNKMMEAEDNTVTDDAMVVERYENCKVKMLYGSYENIKITTPEDLKMGAVFLQNI